MSFFIVMLGFLSYRLENNYLNIVYSKVEKQWQKRVLQWQLEREARRKMTEEMVVIRKQQIAEKC